MEAQQAIAALGALAHETRLALFRLLVQRGPDGLSAGTIAEALDLPPSSLTFHLQQLTHAGLISQRRLGRQLFYATDFAAMNQVVAYLTENCCGGGAVCEPVCRPATAAKTPSTEMEIGVMPETQVYNVLFLCTGNSARSIMAEAILNRAGAGRFKAYSAGSHPKGAVHPRTIDLLRRLHYPTEMYRSKPWDEFAAPGAPVLDFVFTVCDSAAQEVCPVWPGQPMTAHWGVPDPAAATGTEAEIGLAFSDAYRQLNNRISIFVNLPLPKLDRLSLQQHLDEIGKTRSESPSDAGN